MILDPFDIGPPAGVTESDAFARLFMDALMGAAPSGTEWLDGVRTRVWGLGDVRVAREHGAVIGGLAVFDFGQYWGGRSLRCGGVSVVAVAPEARGRGVARA
ncbi:MAG: GNAT family N-acetyltransferase [Deltaproteobacteria bacterium]